MGQGNRLLRLGTLVARGLRLPLRDQLWTARVLLVSIAVEIGVRRVPLPKLAGWLGVNLADASGRSDSHPVAGRRLSHYRRQFHAVNRIMSRWHLADGPCLRQSLVLGHILRKEQPLLLIGVRRSGTVVKAHAWLEVGGRTIGGLPGYVPLPLSQLPALPLDGLT